jgi:hypothetical protein
MRCIRLFGAAWLAMAMFATAAHAQYGLFGAPETVPMPSAQPAAYPYASYPTAQGYAVQTSAVQPAAAYYAPQPIAVQGPQPTPARRSLFGSAPAQQLPPGYAAPTHPATTRPLQTAAVAMYPTGAMPQYPAYPHPAYAVMAADPSGAPVPMPNLEEPPEASPAPAPTPAPAPAPVPVPVPAGPSPSPSDAAPNGLMNDMLGQPACGGYNGYAPGPAYYGVNQGCAAGGCSEFQQAACNGCGDDCQPYCPWYGSLMMLTLGRDRANGVWTSYQTTNLPNQLCNTRDVEAAWQWGGEVTLGRRFCCGCGVVGLQATYWTLAPTDGERFCTSTPSVSTPLTFFPTEFAGDDTRDWFDSADAHRLRRRNEFHNVEINLVGMRNQDCQSIWGIDWLIGFRYFRFEESLQFASLSHGGSWQTGADWAAIDDRIENNLWGFQIGANADLQLSRSVKLFCTPKVGVYNNHIENTFALYRGDGVVGDTGPYTDLGTYPVRSSYDQISFLTEINLGLDWQFSQRWSARIGYRVIAATGIGLADNQIPSYIVDIPEISRIDTNGHLILHGAFAGVTYNF